TGVQTCALPICQPVNMGRHCHRRKNRTANSARQIKVTVYRLPEDCLIRGSPAPQSPAGTVIPPPGAATGPTAALAHDRGDKTMSRLSLFNSPLLLGFEPFERALDRVNKVSSDGYPPYNIEQLGENELRITLAVAGFTMTDLTTTIEDNQLVIRGKQTDDGQRIYLHRGIAARQFQRSFVLAEG